MANNLIDTVELLSDFRVRNLVIIIYGFSQMGIFNFNVVKTDIT